MKKSSLGKRSSLSQQGSIIFSNKPIQKKGNEDSGAKKSLIPKPAFTSRGSRPTSVDRDVTSHFIKREPLRRSKSALNIDVSHVKRESSSDIKRSTNMNVTMGSTSTPRQSGIYNYNGALSTGGNRARVLCSSSEKRRPSSMGEKMRKKETRPITEKLFQMNAEEKVLNFFSRDDEGCAILNNGPLKPMNANRFVEMLNYLVKIIDPRTVITKTNYAEDIIQLAKTYMYKGRMERSLIISVGASHSWPYVLAFLLWLVELCMVAEAQDPFESMYPMDIQDTEADINDINFRLLVPHLLNAFNAYNRGSDDEKEINQCMMELRAAEKITDEDIEQLEQDYARLEKENHDIEELSGGQKLTDFKNVIETFNSEIAECKEFIRNGEEFIDQMTQKAKADDEKIKQLESHVQSLSKRTEELRLRINSQKVSYNEKQQMKQEMEKLKNEVECLTHCIPQYKDINFDEDLKVTAVRNQFESVCLAYNKDVIDNLPSLPQLKETMINHNILHQNAAEYSNKIDKILHSVKSELQDKQITIDHELRELKLQVEKAEKDLMSLKDNLTKLKHEYEEANLHLHMKTKSMEKDTEAWSSSMLQLENKNRQLIDSMPNVQYFRNSVQDAETELKELQESYDTLVQETQKEVCERTEAIKMRNLLFQERMKTWTLQELVGGK